MLAPTKPSHSWLALIFLTSMSPSLAQAPQIIVTRLTHFQSNDSPFYDPTRTLEDLAQIDLSSSISRAMYLTSDPLSYEPADIESQLTPGKLNGFLVHIRVGSNEVEQLMYMDTGSSLLWVNCEPCGLNVPGPIFDPKYSSTYDIENCDFTDICDNSGAVRIQCDDSYYDEGCKYKLAYGSGFSRGNLARETFMFGIHGNETLTRVFFGCARATNLYMNGILGLGHAPVSLFSQYGASKFSYCIGNATDRSYAHNTLVIGNKVELWGQQTPLIVEDTYYVNLVEASIGNTRLRLDRKMFRRNSRDYTGGMVVDSGSTLSFIPQAALTRFEEAIRDVIQNKLGLNLRPISTISYQSYVRLCYGGVVTRDLNLFPIVKFHFEGRAYMYLNPENIFQQVGDETFCLGILPSDSLGTSVSILGNLMQQNHYLAFDIGAEKLSFKRADCEKVEDYYEHDEL